MKLIFIEALALCIPRSVRFQNSLHPYQHLVTIYVSSSIKYLFKSFNHYLMGYFLIVQFWEYFVCSEYKSFVRFVIYKYMLLVHKVFSILWTMSSIKQNFLKFWWRPNKVFFFRIMFLMMYIKIFSNSNTQQKFSRVFCFSGVL